MRALSDLANHQFDAIDHRNLEAAMKPEEDPVLQNLLQLLPTTLERLGVGENAPTLGNLAVERAVIRQDLVPGMVHRGVDVVS